MTHRLIYVKFYIQKSRRKKELRGSGNVSLFLPPFTHTHTHTHIHTRESERESKSAAFKHYGSSNCVRSVCVCEWRERAACVCVRERGRDCLSKKERRTICINWWLSFSFRWWMVRRLWNNWLWHQLYLRKAFTLTTFFYSQTVPWTTSKPPLTYIFLLLNLSLKDLLCGRLSCVLMLNDLWIIFKLLYWQKYSFFLY